ncbi:MAG TPA: homocysteine S-methyltransferase family protein [Bradyrhizobium sp.]|nr:homocysteine S-methyltransferase family protein [Bradyrhizobium sp.]
MAKYRDELPQLSDKLFLTDAGMETYLIFHEGVDLPLFMAFPLLKDPQGLGRVRAYYERFCAMARDSASGLVLESPTWRANRDWAQRIGYSKQDLADVNRKAIDLMADIRARFETTTSPMVISGNIGPRGDGYVPGQQMSAEAAQDYHAEQIEVFRGTEADMVSAFTLNYVEEAIGVTRAAVAANIPVAISFTVETDGRLPTGQTLGDAISEVDAQTGAAPIYYMLNCAHPTHFADSLEERSSWVKRLRGLRANASRRSHAELDTMTDLDAGDLIELAQQYADLRRQFRHINVLGGCCGTDHRHVAAIAAACFACEEARI